MCAECHSTNVQKNYIADRDTFDTKWSELNVSCEACHGPASRHVEWARHPPASPNDRNKGLEFSLDGRSRMAWRFAADRPIARSAAPLPSRSEVETCGRCHARRSQIWPEYTYGRPLADTHRVSLLEEGLYEADGQQLDEVYEYGSFLQSKMYAAGVTCSNCHNPHSGALVVPGKWCVRAMPSASHLRRAVAPFPQERLAWCLVRLVPHAGSELHGRACQAGSRLPDPTTRSDGLAGRPERVHVVSPRQATRLGGCSGRAMVRSGCAAARLRTRRPLLRAGREPPALMRRSRPS